jgi:hypothetical protein
MFSVDNDCELVYPKKLRTVVQIYKATGELLWQTDKSDTISDD